MPLCPSQDIVQLFSLGDSTTRRRPLRQPIPLDDHDFRESTPECCCRRHPGDTATQYDRSIGDQEQPVDIPLGQLALQATHHGTTLSQDRRFEGTLVIAPTSDELDDLPWSSTTFRGLRLGYGDLDRGEGGMQG